jgi:polar amino acid transport system substrate-binding protein
MSKRWNSSLPSALVLMGVVAFSFVFVARAQAQSGPVCAALVITGHPSYPPVAWAAEGKIVGAAPDLVSGIAAKLGVKDVVSKDFGSWEDAQQAVRGGQADMIFGIYKNASRALYLDYIEPPFMMDPVSIVVRKGAGFAFAEWSDLKGRKGVDKAFEALLAQQADFMIIGLFPGRNEARKLGLIDRIEFLPKELVSAPMYVALSKQSKCGALRTGFSVGIKTAVDADAMRQLLEGADKSLGH